MPKEWLRKSIQDDHETTIPELMLESGMRIVIHGLS
jgi:hypothetical protein